MEKKKYSNFLRMWFAGLISAVGSGFTGYGLGIWVFLKTGEVTKYSMISLVTVLPGILIGAFAGVLVDFYNRKKTMVLCDSVCFVLSATIFWLIHTDKLEIWHLYILLSIISLLAAVRWTAYASSIVLTVEKDRLQSANGLDQFTNAASQILPPILAALIVKGHWGVQCVILIDTVSYLISLILIPTVKIDYIPPKHEGQNIWSIFMDKFKIGLNFLLERKPLLGLLGYMALLNYISGGVSVLFSPMILSFASQESLSLIMGFAGVGMLIGSILVMIVKRMELNTKTMLSFSILFSLSTILAGLIENVAVICIAGFLFFMSVAVVGSAFQYVFQKKVPAQIQGRVFAVRKVIVTSTLPLSYITLGPIADYVFKPLLSKNGVLAQSLGKIYGIGVSRGIGLLLITLGILALVMIMLVYKKLNLKDLDRLIQDALGENECMKEGD